VNSSVLCNAAAGESGDLTFDLGDDSKMPAALAKNVRLRAIHEAQRALGGACVSFFAALKLRGGILP
jgi:hypothetical protein